MSRAKTGKIGMHLLGSFARRTSALAAALVLVAHIAIAQEAATTSHPDRASEPAGAPARTDTATSAKSGNNRTESPSSELVQRGYRLISSRSLDAAIAAFDEALKVSPTLHEALTGKGIALRQKGSMKEAELALQAALHLNPNPVRALYELGRVYEQEGELDKAMMQYKLAIKKHEQGR